VTIRGSEAAAARSYLSDDLDRANTYFRSVAETWLCRYERSPSFRARLSVLASLILCELDQRPSAVVLDYGSGAGVFAAVASSRASFVVSMDLVERMIASHADGQLIRLAEAVGARAELGRVAKVVGDLEGFSGKADGTFDLVLAVAVLEYLSDPLAALGRLLDLVAPGGVLVFTVPNHRSLYRLLERNIEAARNALRSLTVTRGSDRRYTAIRPHGDRPP
jgi:SAM-dependent methyltransferase